PRHEPLPDGRTPPGLGWSVSGPERERRQTQILAPAQRRPLAQDNARPMRLGGEPQERQLLQGAVQPIAQQARPAESHLRCRRLDADRDLPHAEGRHPPPGPRRRPLRPPVDRGQSQASRRPAHQARLPGRASTPPAGGMMSLRNFDHRAWPQPPASYPARPRLGRGRAALAPVCFFLVDCWRAVEDGLKTLRGIDPVGSVLRCTTRLSRINYNFDWYLQLIYCILTCIFVRALPWVIGNGRIYQQSGGIGDQR